MKEFDHPGMQHDSSGLATALGSIFQIAFDRPTGGGKLCADLVVSAGFWRDREEEIAFGFSDECIVHFCYRDIRTGGAVLGKGSGKIASVIEVDCMFQCA